MTDTVARSDRIWLAPSEARCVPEKRCIMQVGCARRMAAIPASGAMMVGAGLPTLPGWCGMFEEIKRRSDKSPDRPVRKHWDA
jgi:hypothetical protein